MPLYDFKCPIHGIYEILLPRVPDLDYRECDIDSTCLEMAEIQVPLANMQPDKYWAGHVVHGDYVTKKSQINKNFVPADRDTVEYVQKKSERRFDEWEEKTSNNLKKFLAEELAGVTVDPDGYTVKQRRKYVESRKRATTDANGE